MNGWNSKILSNLDSAYWIEQATLISMWSDKFLKDIGDMWEIEPFKLNSGLCQWKQVDSSCDKAFKNEFKLFWDITQNDGRYLKGKRK